MREKRYKIKVEIVEDWWAFAAFGMLIWIACFFVGGLYALSINDISGLQDLNTLGLWVWFPLTLLTIAYTIFWSDIYFVEVKK